MKLNEKQTIAMNKDIPSYAGLYKIDRYGNVHTENWRNTGKHAILKPAKDKKGYLRVALIKDGVLVTHKVHRLVALTFIPNPEGKPQVNHINGIKSDNNIENLEWCTPKENTSHAIKHGIFVFTNSERAKNVTPKRGELNGLSKLNDKIVLEIRAKFKPKVYTRAMLAKEYGVKESCIKDVVLRKSWKHI